MRGLGRSARWPAVSHIPWVLALCAAWRPARARGPAQHALVAVWRRRLLVHALALPVLARGLGCRPWHPLLWATYVLQQADLYLHLGLNRGPDRAPLRPSLPVATECTLLRAYAAAALLAGTPHPRRALVVGALSDLIDGALARRAGGETALGGLLDGEYDAYLLLAAAHAARRQGRLAPAAERLLWLRFIGVLLAGAVAAVAGRPVSVHSSGPGKVASGLQAATVYGAMAPGRRLPRRGQVGTVGLSTVLAVGGQIHRLWAAGRAPCSSSSR